MKIKLFAVVVVTGVITSSVGTADAQVLLRRFYYDVDGSVRTITTPSYCPWGNAERCRRASNASGRYTREAGVEFCRKQCGRK